MAPVCLAISGVQSLPCQSIRCAGGSSVMPSHHTSPSSVSATLVKIDVALQARHAVGVGLLVGAGRDAEVTGFGIDRIQAAVGARLDPCDVVADRRDLPAVEAGRRNQHREVGLAAGAREGGRDVVLPASGAVTPSTSMCSASQPDDFVACAHDRCDAQREALLAEQRIAAVARTVAPDLPRLGVVDMYLVGLHGQATSFCPARAARPRVHARNEAPRRRARRAPCRPMRVMIRMLTATYGMSDSSTPMCAIGEPSGPMLNGTTYIVRPRIAPLNSARVYRSAAARASRPVPSSCWWDRPPRAWRCR